MVELNRTMVNAAKDWVRYGYGRKAGDEIDTHRSRKRCGISEQGQL